MPEDHMRSDCQEIFRDIREDLMLIRKAVEGNGNKGLKEKVAENRTALKILGAAVIAIGTAVIGAFVRVFQ